MISDTLILLLNAHFSSEQGGPLKIHFIILRSNKKKFRIPVEFIVFT